MSYTLKLQCSGDFFKRVIIIRTNRYNGNNICGQCLHSHTRIIERRYSKNVPTSNLLYKQNVKLNGETKPKTNKQVVMGNKKFKKYQKISELNEEKASALCKKHSIKSSFSYNSANSYDSTYLIPSGSIAKFVENLIDGTVPTNFDLMNTKVNCDKNRKESLSHSNKMCSNDESKKEVKYDSKIITNQDIKFYAHKENDLKNKANENEETEHARSNNDFAVNNICNEFRDKYLGPKSVSQVQSNEVYSMFELICMIQSYVDVAVFNNTPKEGIRALQLCANKKQTWQKINRHPGIVESFNYLLTAYVDDWTAICEIRNLMKKSGVVYNYQSYANLLDSLGKHKRKFCSYSEWENNIIEILSHIKQRNINLSEIITKTIITKNQCENILLCIRSVVPDFEVAPVKINLNHTDPLLINLFNKNKKIESQLENNFTLKTIKNLVDEQCEIEKKFTIQVQAIKVKGVGKNSPEEAAKVASLKQQWRTSLYKGLLDNLTRTDLTHSSTRSCFNLSTYLKCLPTEMLVDVMMNSTLELVEYSGGYSPNVRLIQKNLGDQIYQRYQILKKEKSGILDFTKEVFKNYSEWYLNPTGPAKNSRQEWQMLMQEFPNGCLLDRKTWPKWPDNVKIGIGKFLYDVIYGSVKIASYEGARERLTPVFYSVLRRSKSMCVEEVKCHPTVSKLFLKCGFDKINFSASNIPMVCPPKPWTSVTHGGYLALPVEFTRSLREVIGKRIDFSKLPIQQLYPTFDSLNSLQMVPWTINKSVLNVALTLFANGGDEKLDVPEYPNMDPIGVDITDDMTSVQRSAEYKRKKIILLERQNQYGLWCEALYRLSLANYFRNRIFWLPQNFDFRGRVYPIPPHLNHIGGDLFRSLLIFAKGKPLGPKGLDWLKIHTINLTGSHKRKSASERLEYANSILPVILDSAENPLTGDRWWSKSDEPWQTLAGCMEIKRVLESGDPENFVSRFPIHQDGSCNGLQHYAALGRDTLGAKSVNLTPCSTPQDVYTDVIEVIEKLRQEDASNGVEIAKSLEGYVQRKVVKQTIMTSVYGVTQYGARLQIASKLEDMPDFPRHLVWQAAGYLTVKTFQSLQKMFSSAKEIQDWFIQCATIICNQNDYVQWVSPLGLPILQPYAKKYFKKQNNKIKASYLRPNSMKQKNAFPPNFVHSLDSTHMMLTAQFCEQENLTFASIHDCYWTHPCTVDIMNQICREQFISLYSQPILENLTKHFIEKYGKENEKEVLEVFSRIPGKGDFNLNLVSDSVYFFS